MSIIIIMDQLHHNLIWDIAPTQDAKTIISSIVCPRHFGVALSII